LCASIVTIEAKSRGEANMSDSNSNWAKAVGAVLAVAAVGGGVYYFTQPAAPPAPAPVSAPINAVADIPPQKYPVPEAPAQPEQTPLPDLQDSDPSAIAELLALFGEPAVAALLKPEFLIPRIVATVDNLPRQKLNSHAFPVRTVPGAFLTTADGNSVSIAEANAARYTPYVDAFMAADNAQLLALYQRWYPLFQQAYRELGDPNVHFNDRLVEVIDHMLAAPDAPPPIVLVMPRAVWEYADPALQGASIGHRLMFRIGPAHAARIKAKLLDLRGSLVALATAPE
jgi:hypothetical protein